MPRRLSNADRVRPPRLPDFKARPDRVTLILRLFRAVDSGDRAAEREAGRGLALLGYRVEVDPRNRKGEAVSVCQLWQEGLESDPTKQGPAGRHTGEARGVLRTSLPGSKDMR